MKKLTLITIVLTLILAACGSASAATQAGPASSTESLPVATQLLVGTMKLDGTEQDVNAEQAAQLLPLWQVYSELLTSDIAAQEEIDGLVTQIQETMTDEQMQAIEDMALTQEDVMAAMQENGGAMDQASPSGSSSSSGSSGGGFTPPDGGMPMGAPPDGGAGMPGGGQSLSPEQIATAQAARGTNGGGPNRVSAPLLNALIQFLEEKAGS